MSAIDLQGLHKAYASTRVLHGLNLSIEEGEFVVLLGPSGCGKSTLLKLIAGLEPLTGDHIAIGGQRVDGLDPGARGLAMVFQSYALYPHMTVRGNLGFRLKMERRSAEEIASRIADVAHILRLDHLLDRYPRQLSGGQRQRVAIGRALARRPKVLLFDEPLSNLDAELRGQTRVEIARLHKALGTTILYVTHDQVEAMTLATRIVLMNEGQIEQVGTPLDLYHRPQTLFVARFMGSPAINLWEVPGGTEGIRPEDVRLADGAEVSVMARVDLVEELGDLTICHFEAEDGRRIIAKLPAGNALYPGQLKGLTWDLARLHRFGQDGRRL